MAEVVDERRDFRQGHGIHGFRCAAWGHGSVVGIQPGIGPEVEFRVIQLSVEVSQWYPSLATFSDDTQDSFGAPHLAYLSAVGIQSPAALRHVRGFPSRGLLRRLRRHGPRGR